MPGSFESCREWLSDQLVNRFNQYSRYFAKVDDDFDIIQYITGAIRYCNYFDLVPFCTGRLLNEFDTITDFKYTKIRGNFRISTGDIRLKFPNNFDSLRYWTKDHLSGIFHRNASCRDNVCNRFDAIFHMAICRQPDVTVWYSSSQTEYRTTFNQTAPAYVTIAAMRLGNEPELGKIHELFLT